jgi:hypothetical protein
LIVNEFDQWRFQKEIKKLEIVRVFLSFAGVKELGFFVIFVVVPLNDIKLQQQQKQNKKH